MRTASPTTPATLSPAILLIGGLVLLLPVFFSGQWDQVLLGLCLLLIGLLVCLWALRAYTRPGWNWILIGWVWVGFLTVHTWFVSGVQLESMQAVLWSAAGWGIFLVGASVGRVTGLPAQLGKLLLVVQALAVLGAGVVYMQAPARLFGWLGNPNALGGFLLFGVLVLATLVWSGWRRRVTVTLLGLLSLAWLGTFSLTSFVASALPLVLLAGFIRSDSTQSARLRRMGLAVVALLVAGVTVWMVADRTGALSRREVGFSFRQRWEFVESSLRLWQDRPLLGWGIGTFQVALPQGTLQANEQPRYAHSLFVQQFAELGTIGGLAWLVIVWLIGRTGWRAVRDSSDQPPWVLGLWLGWLGFTLAALLDFSWFFPAGQLWWWAIGGCLVAIAHRNQSSQVSNRAIRIGAAVIGLALATVAGLVLLSENQTLRGKSKFSVSEFEPAVRSLSEAHRYWPTRENTLFLVRSYWARRSPGDLDRATAVLESALRRNPDDYALYFEAGQLARWRQDSSAMAEAYRQAYERNKRFNPQYPIVYAGVLIDREEYHQAALVAAEALAIYQSRYADIAWPDARQIQQLRDLLVIARQHNQ